jgi:hypothetical protein
MKSLFSKSPKRPDFLIVGTMKGGTTMLYHFITLHPDIEKASSKEIHYFTLNYDKGDEWYFNHFPSKPNKLTGEASPTYFDCADIPTIPAMIKRMNDVMKIILIVRDPLERAVSHYNHFCKIAKFPEVLALDVNQFFNIPFSEILTRSTTLGFRAEQTISFSLYYRKYLSYESVFGRDNILVLSNRNLRDSPFETMKEVYSFLGVHYVQNNRFKDIGYSHGTDLTKLDTSTFTRLAELFYPDYQKFCEKTGLPYSELDPSVVLHPTSNHVAKPNPEETHEQA